MTNDHPNLDDLEPLDADIVGRGHLITGTRLMDKDGITDESAYLRCEDLQLTATDVLAKIDREDRAYPPLTTCGRHTLA